MCMLTGCSDWVSERGEGLESELVGAIVILSAIGGYLLRRAKYEVKSARRELTRKRTVQERQE